MKKILLLVSIVVLTFFMVACNNKQETPQSNNNIAIANSENESASKVINFNKTSINTLKNARLIPSNTIEGNYYDVGKAKLGEIEYDIKYVKHTEIGEEEKTYENDIISFWNDGENKLEILLNTTLEYGEYTKEISIFKDEYLVEVSDTNTGDKLQFIQILDENLELATPNGTASIPVNAGYDNYYTINREDIKLINSIGDEKVTYRIYEEDEGLQMEEIDRITEGVLQPAGRT